MKTQSHLKKVVCAVIVCISVCSLLCVSGCIKPDEETLARIDELESQLKHLEDQLQQAQAQRQTGLEKLEAMSATLAAAQSQLQELIQIRELMESRQAATDTKLSEFAVQRDAAMNNANESRAELEQLQAQLLQQAEAIAGAKLQITDLQEAITPPEEEVVASAETTEPIVGFPEEDDPSVIVIRGPSQK